MKALKFLGNRVEDAANAFIDVLKYSDQSVDYPDFNDIEPWPDDIVNMFKDALKNKSFSEISAILMYTQQSSRFDPIAELMLGIGLVEMRHYDKLSDFLQKADPYEGNSVMDIYPKVEIGFSPESALKIALDSEIETIGHYKKIMNNVALYNDRADYDDVMYLLNKLVADEEHHIKLLKEAMGMDKSTKGVTVIIK
jgi:rubrerythrin